MTANIWDDDRNNTVCLSVSSKSKYGEDINKDTEALDILPGHLIRQIEVSPPSEVGGESVVGVSLCRTQDDLFSTMFAVENFYIGGTLNDEYEEDRRVLYRIMNLGDVVYARVQPGISYPAGANLTLGTLNPGVLDLAVGTDKVIAIAMAETGATERLFLPVRIV